MSYAPVHRSVSVALGNDQSDDIDAIAHYMANTAIVSDAARKIQDEWKVWLDGVSWYDKRYDRPTYDRARNIRNRFSLANVRTAAERENVQRVITSGMTTEEMQGDPSRVSSEGTFSEKDGGTAPSLPIWAKFAIGFGVVGVGVYALHEVNVFAGLFKKAPKK